MEYTEGILSDIFPFWGALSRAERDALVKSAARVRYAKGELVHGGSCAGITVVCRGCIRAALLSEEGREITLYRLEEGDFCMLSASCVIEAVSFDVHFTAAEDSECLLLGAEAFSAVAQAHKDAQIFALEKTVERFSDVMWAMQQLLFLSLDARIAAHLVDACVRTGSDTLALTHEEIARDIGSAREATSRLLKLFEKEGYLTLSRGKITIKDGAALRALVR